MCIRDSRDPFVPSSGLEDSLNNRTGELTPEQAQEQLEKARERKKEKVRMLASIIEMMNSSKSGENPFQTLVPGSSSDPSLGGLLSLSSDASDFMQDLVLDNLFDGAYMQFNHEAKAYTNL